MSGMKCCPRKYRWIYWKFCRFHYFIAKLYFSFSTSLYISSIVLSIYTVEVESNGCVAVKYFLHPIKWKTVCTIMFIASFSEKPTEYDTMLQTGVWQSIKNFLSKYKNTYTWRPIFKLWLPIIIIDIRKLGILSLNF